MNTPIILLVKFLFLALGLSMAGLAVFIWHDVRASREFRRRLVPPAVRPGSEMEEHHRGALSNTAVA